MEAHEKPEFMTMLAEALAGYEKPLPEAGMVKAWLSQMAEFPLGAIREALRIYAVENTKFPPVPNGIAALCRNMDGRPGAEEAWAIALTSRDEADSVVWTAECAEAFRIAKPILDLGDEVGARMAFKESYIRIVAQARAVRRPAVWSMSAGWDPLRRLAAESRAVAAGLLPAPAPVAMLAGPGGDGPDESDRARAQLAKIKELIAAGAAAKAATQEAAAERRRQTERQQRHAVRLKLWLHFDGMVA
ncbi:MAG: hypothetical protein K2X55_21215 [Burkholderiaceae bacterium]|nr:hypothetical protein [Burkholderiaceae bacterium]